MSNSLQTMDYSPPGSSVQGILQARILEWVHPFPSPGDLSNPVIEPGSAFQADFFYYLSYQGSLSPNEYVEIIHFDP